MNVKELLNTVYSDSYSLDSADSYYLLRLYSNWGEDCFELQPE